MKKKRSDYLWIASLLYLFLGLFHILFAWLGLICFLVPLLLAVGKGEKSYCNHYCGRGQLMQRLGNRFSAQRACPGGFAMVSCCSFYQCLPVCCI